jgi:hypothetical protein
MTLSSVTIPPGAGLRRDSPRPPHLRNARYADQFDWDTLFYDVYRVGESIVMQGPPLFNLAAPVLTAQTLRNRFGPLFPRTRRVERINASELWLRDSSERLFLETPLGTFDIAVQPSEIQRFAGRRVLHTLSKDNEVRWIIDWIRYHERVHGADAVLFYDNGSSRYSASELQAELTDAFPAMVVVVVSWPFKYGPQGGMAGAVDGQPAPWDSDYCQAGSLQHARLRFLRGARSVLNADIDELVVGPESIFAATEASPGGFIKFPGQWITSATPHPVTLADSRHGNFLCRDVRETDTCPPKWCVVPSACDDRRHSWSVHNLFGSRANKQVSKDFSFRHFKAISNNWKGDRGDAGAFDPQRFVEDGPLCDALTRAGLRTAPS